MIRVAIGLCAFIVLIWAGYHATSDSESARISDIAMTSVRGEKFRLSDLRGHPVVLTFWASDCGPCIAEIPEFVQMDRELGGRGLRLVAVAMDYDLPSRVLALITAAGVSYRVVLDLGGGIAEAFDHIDAVPTTFLIGPEGVILDRLKGPIDFIELREKILTMLRDS